jgi:hypothetical protein
MGPLERRHTAQPPDMRTPCMGPHPTRARVPLYLYGRRHAHAAEPRVHGAERERGGVGEEEQMLEPVLEGKDVCDVAVGWATWGMSARRVQVNSDDRPFEDFCSR